MDAFSKIDRTFRACLPVTLALLFVVLNMAPWPSPMVHALLDPLPLVILCYWVVHRPDLFPTWASFLVGLLRDALTGQFLGVSAFSFVLADFMLRSQRDFMQHQGFFANWFIYALVLFGVSGLQWALASLIAQNFLDFPSVLLRAAFGILLLPLLSGVMQRLQPSWR